MDLAQAALVDRLLDPLGEGVQPSLEDRGQLDAVVFAGHDQGIGLFQVHVERLLADDVLARLRRLDAHLGVQPRRHGDVDHVHVGILEQFLDRGVSPAAVVLHCLLTTCSVDVTDGDQLRALRRLDRAAVVAAHTQPHHRKADRVRILLGHAKFL